MNSNEPDIHEMDFATGQTLHDLMDREFANMRRAPRRTVAPVVREKHNGTVIEELTNAAMPGVIADCRAEKIARAKDPLASERPQGIWDAEHPAEAALRG